jgi:CheY-like chemotaxis protein/HPt (histidine-containing phosphotransfer) domain-containing protein
MSLLDSSRQEPRLGLRVLLAEDQEVNRRVAMRMLERLGCRADVAADGAEALQALAAVAYDVVLMDVHMPVMDGLDATVEFRRRERTKGSRRRTPLVALTGLSEDGDRRLCFAAGMDDYLVKPLVAEDLRDVLERWGASRTPAIDRDRLKTMCGGDAQFERELLASFRESATRAMNAIADAVEHGDAAQLASEAHCLRGVCLTIGAAGLAEMAKSLEYSQNSKDREALVDLLSSLRAEWEVVRGDVEMLMGSAPPIASTQ